ncbi:MAG TPA: ornithine cyclodeaminase family protein [Bacillales bacterium]|nr:ornithine cyclodeaminase family protein [Bacillales bacterium]
MLILNEKDIHHAASMSDIIDAIEHAYSIYEKNEFNMPARSHVAYEHNTLLLMPCFTKSEYGTKIVSVFPENKELPVTQGLMVLNDIENGETKAVMNGTALTGLRTGAIGGAAVRQLTPSGVKKAGLIGTGLQGFYQLMAACSARDFTDIYLYNRSPEKIPAFREKIDNHFDGKINIHEASSSEEVVGNSEVILTATTSSSPVLPNNNALYDGKTVIGVGSFQPSMREFPEALFQACDEIYTDSREARNESGDLTQPLEQGWIEESQIMPFSKIVTGEEKWKPDENRATVFKSTGMALFDVVVSQMIYDKALANGIGQMIDW